VRQLNTGVVALGGIEIETKGLAEFQDFAVGIGEFSKLERKRGVINNSVRRKDPTMIRRNC